MDLQMQKHQMPRWVVILSSIASTILLFFVIVSPAFAADGCYTVGGTQTNTYYGGMPWAVTATVTVPANVLVCGGAPPFIDPLPLIKVEVTGATSFTVSTKDLVWGQGCPGCWNVTIYMYGGACPNINWTGYCVMTFGFPYVIRKNDYSISLSGGNEVEPSNGSTINTLPFIVTVKNQSDGQPPTNPVTVKISLKVDDPKSGGHDHGDSTRPRGGVGNVGTCPSDDTCWSWDSPANNGVVVFNFNPTETSGKYIVSATCKGCSNTETAKVNVKVKEADAAGWDQLTASPAYELVGGEADKEHHDNHYLTATSRKNLIKLVKAYNFEYPTGPVLYLNDASLVWGGKFDISGKWTGAHANHRRGVVIDIRANQLSTAIPLLRFAEFKKIATNNGAFADLHCAFPSRFSWACWADTGPNRHFHVRLLGKGIDR